jgi:ribosomal protein S26
MVKIDRQVREVLTHIRAAEAKKAHLENKVEEAAPTSFSSHLIKSYIVGKTNPHYRLSCALLKTVVLISHYTNIKY